MVFPANSGSFAILAAASAAAPLEIPAIIPSSFARLRAVANASSFVTCSTRSISDMSSTLGMKPAPIPWILCGPGFSVSLAMVWLMTGLSAGSTATTVTSLPLSSLK